jgi:glycosyltransferase involved in cell wall biosynthesis
VRIWLFKDGEALPVETGSRRMRTAMLADALRRDGHDVHWFHSTFLHGPKRLFAEHDMQHAVAPGLTLHLIHAGGFRDNISFERHRFHRRYSRRLREYCAALARPDVIVCAFPLIEVASWVVSFARSAGIPVVVDVRDCWPDTIVGVFPPVIRPLARAALDGDFRRTRAVMTDATAVTAMSNGVLRWALSHARRTPGSGDRVFPIGFPAAQTGPAPPLTQALQPWLPALHAKRLFTYVGTFGRTYDVELIVDAARELSLAGAREPRPTPTAGDREGTPAAHFVLAGSGPRLEHVRRKAQGLSNVTVTGWLDQPDIAALLARSYAGLLPWAGLADAMPNKFFEYIAAGLPVLSSAAGELAALVEREHVGLSFPATAAGLVDAVNQMSAEADQQEMSARARQLFAARFREDLVYREFAAYVVGLASHVDAPARRRA